MTAARRVGQVRSVMTAAGQRQLSGLLTPRPVSTPAAAAICQQYPPRRSAAARTPRTVRNQAGRLGDMTPPGARGSPRLPDPYYQIRLSAARSDSLLPDPSHCCQLTGRVCPARPGGGDCRRGSGGQLSPAAAPQTKACVVASPYRSVEPPGAAAGTETPPERPQRGRKTAAGTCVAEQQSRSHPV